MKTVVRNANKANRVWRTAKPVWRIGSRAEFFSVRFSGVSALTPFVPASSNFKIPYSQARAGSLNGVRSDKARERIQQCV